MRPIRLHLDTSDFAAMYRADSDSPEARIRDWLTIQVEKESIEIGLSYHVFFEFLQKADPEYREDRLARARLLGTLCRRNAFPYPTDIGQGYTFSKEGLWMPRIDLEDTEIEHVVEYVTNGMAGLADLSFHERRIISKRSYFTQWLRSDPSTALGRVLEVWPLRFGQTFVRDGDFTRYMLGETSRADANKSIWFYITDPVSAYGIWFDDYGRGSPIIERRDNLVNTLIVMLNELRRMLHDGKQLEGDVKNALAGELTDEEHAALAKLVSELRAFQAELKSPIDLYERVPIWRERFGDHSALLAAQILYAYHQENRPIKQSDGIDFVHAIYLPHCDLWRGDKAFSDLLIKHHVNFNEHVVRTLAELPARIAAKLS